MPPRRFPFLLAAGAFAALITALALTSFWALSLQSRLDAVRTPDASPTSEPIGTAASPEPGSATAAPVPSVLPTGAAEVDGAVWYPASEPAAYATVAAENSSPENRQSADFAVEGAADDEINAALAALAEGGGGQVKLLEGRFELDSPIIIDGNGLALVGVNVGNGAGYTIEALGTQIVPSDDFAGDFLLTTTPDAYGPMISLLHFDGLGRVSGVNVESRRPTVTLNAVTQAGEVGMRFAGESTGNRPYDGYVLFNRVFDGSGIGVLHDHFSGDMLIEGNVVFRNDGDGFRCLGASQMYRVNHAYNNAGVGLRIIPGCVRTRLSSNKWEGNASGGVSIEGGSGYTMVGDTFAHNQTGGADPSAHVQIGVRGDEPTTGVMLWGLSFGKGSDDNPHLVHVGSLGRDVHIGPVHSAGGSSGEPFRIDDGAEVSFYDDISDPILDQ
jgi:hypothetical protein